MFMCTLLDPWHLLLSAKTLRNLKGAMDPMQPPWNLTLLISPPRPESPRFLRRLNTLRGLSHEQVEQVFTRGA